MVNSNCLFGLRYGSYFACVYTKVAELFVYVFISLKELRQRVEHGELTAHTYLLAGAVSVVKSGSVRSCVSDEWLSR